MWLDASWAETVMLSLPGGILIVSVHVHGPAPGHVALPRVTGFAPSWLALTAVTCAAVSWLAVFNVNTIFDVDDDTYAGRRVLLLVVGSGIVIVNVASESAPVYCGAGGAVGAVCGMAALCEPPPHAARDADTAIARTEETKFFTSRFMGTNPQPLHG
jgi:hypothetical protein